MTQLDMYRAFECFRSFQSALKCFKSVLDVQLGNAFIFSGLVNPLVTQCNGSINDSTGALSVLYIGVWFIVQ